MLWSIKLAGNKVWNCANRWNFERWHGTWFWKNVYSLWVNCCYGTSFFFFDLHWCILIDIEIFIILTNVYTLILVYFYVCRWKVKKKKTNNVVNKTFLKITQVIEVSLAVTLVQANNDDHYVWTSKEAILFFEIYISVKSDILFNVMDIVS